MQGSDDLVRLMAEHTYGTWRAQKGWKQPLLVARAEGSCFWDGAGKRYLDLSSQLMCSNLGHGNRAVMEAIAAEAQRLPYVAPGFVTESKARAVEALLTAMPAGLDQFFFSSSGTEANEAALQVARQYQAPHGCYKVISRYRSYHGATAGSIALTGDYRRWFAEPVNKTPGVVFAPDAYCYRCPFGQEYPGCGITCASYLDYMIQEEGSVAALILEPVVGTNGVIVPPPEYLPRVREIADKHEVLLIADEVMSGWHRTGPCFAVEHWGVTPDIITTAKGCTAAYTPVGITATTGKLRAFFEERFFSHGHTYSAHPLTLAAVPAALAEYRRLLATGQPQAVSQHLGESLRALQSRHPSIGDVRGLGHFWALELVRNRETKEPFGTKADKAALRPLLVDRLAAQMMARGLYVVSWMSHFVIAPPLVITKEEVDEALAILDEVLAEADGEAAA
jgi:taurine--2-oxoglutarate transaminase